MKKPPRGVDKLSGLSKTEFSGHRRAGNRHQNCAGLPPVRHFSLHFGPSSHVLGPSLWANKGSQAKWRFEEDPGAYINKIPQTEEETRNGTAGVGAASPERAPQARRDSGVDDHEGPATQPTLR